MATLQVVSDAPQLSHLLLSVNSGSKPKLDQQHHQQQLTAVGGAGNASPPSTLPMNLSDQEPLPADEHLNGTANGWQQEEAVGAGPASSRGTTDSSGLDKESSLENGLAGAAGPSGAAEASR